jgi:hypothetical protein
MPIFASRNVNMAARLDAMSFVVRTSVTPEALPARRATLLNPLDAPRTD